MIRNCQRCHEQHDIPPGCRRCASCRDAAEQKRKNRIERRKDELKRHLAIPLSAKGSGRKNARSILCGILGCKEPRKRKQNGQYETWCAEHLTRYLLFGNPHWGPKDEPLPRVKRAPDAPLR